MKTAHIVLVALFIFGSALLFPVLSQGQSEEYTGYLSDVASAKKRG